VERRRKHDTILVKMVNTVSRWTGTYAVSKYGLTGGLILTNTFELVKGNFSKRITVKATWKEAVPRLNIKPLIKKYQFPIRNDPKRNSFFMPFSITPAMYYD
jgi:hypothetical protein